MFTFTQHNSHHGGYARGAVSRVCEAQDMYHDGMKTSIITHPRGREFARCVERWMHAQQEHEGTNCGSRLGRLSGLGGFGFRVTCTRKNCGTLGLCHVQRKNHRCHRLIASELEPQRQPTQRGADGPLHRPHSRGAPREHGANVQVAHDCPKRSPARRRMDSRPSKTVAQRAPGLTIAKYGQSAHWRPLGCRSSSTSRSYSRVQGGTAKSTCDPRALGPIWHRDPPGAADPI